MLKVSLLLLKNGKKNTTKTRKITEATHSTRTSFVRLISHCSFSPVHVFLEVRLLTFLLVPRIHIFIALFAAEEILYWYTLCERLRLVFFMRSEVISTFHFDWLERERERRGALDVAGGGEAVNAPLHAFICAHCLLCSSYTSKLVIIFSVSFSHLAGMECKM